ncbi:MAG: amidohydrolase family protein, partial [Chloroflexota bacterium]
DWKGELIYPQEKLNEMICEYHKRGNQVVIHGNGDGAIESILQAFELAQEQFPREDPRHMLIHCQMASDDHIEQMKRLGVIPSYFINHVYYWGDRHKKLFLGPERAARINPLGSSKRAGLTYTMHTDFPVTPYDPWRTLHTAVNRETSGDKVLGEAECLTAEEALRGYTLYAAMCSFEENIKGSLEVGKLADFAIISDNLLTMNPREIKDVQVLQTVVGGRTVYEQTLSGS